MKEAQLEAFWSHIESNAALLASMISVEDDAFESALQNLQKIHADLYLVIGNSPLGRELIITAEGDSALFSLVDEIVSAAPQIPGWKIIALKPRCGFAEFAKWNEVHIAIQDVYFEPFELAGGGLGIRLLIPQCDATTAKEAKLALIQAMEFALGERAFAHEVLYVELGEKNSSIDNDIPLAQLEEYIAWRNKRLG
jgi:hypothetical protein